MDGEPIDNGRLSELFGARKTALEQTVNHAPRMSFLRPNWFAERDDGGASHLVPLADFKARRDESVRRRYLGGRYGGIPTLDPAEFKHAVGVCAGDTGLLPAARVNVGLLNDAVRGVQNREKVTRSSLGAYRGLEKRRC